MSETIPRIKWMPYAFAIVSCLLLTSACSPTQDYPAYAKSLQELPKSLKTKADEESLTLYAMLARDVEALEQAAQMPVAGDLALFTLADLCTRYPGRWQACLPADYPNKYLQQHPDDGIAQIMAAIWSLQTGKSDAALANLVAVEHATSFNDRFMDTARYFDTALMQAQRSSKANVANAALDLAGARSDSLANFSDHCFSNLAVHHLAKIQGTFEWINACRVAGLKAVQLASSITTALAGAEIAATGAAQVADDEANEMIATALASLSDAQVVAQSWREQHAQDGALLAEYLESTRDSGERLYWLAHLARQ